MLINSHQPQPSVLPGSSRVHLCSSPDSPAVSIPLLLPGVPTLSSPWGPAAPHQTGPSTWCALGMRQPYRGRRYCTGPGDALCTWLCVPVLSPLRATGLHPARRLRSRRCSLLYGARGREAEKFRDMHLNKIFLTEFPMRCQQLFNIILPLLADHVITPAGGESGCQLPTGKGR